MGTLERLLYLGFSFLPWICLGVFFSSLLIGIIKLIKGYKSKKCLIICLISLATILVWWLVILGVLGILKLG